MPRYLSLPEVHALHHAVMERTGSSPQPLRDAAALESAVLRPHHAARYEGADLVRQAALLALGISRAQAYLDGNKRTAFAAADVFLRVNGFEFVGDPVELARRLERVAEATGARPAAEADFEAFLRARTVDRR